MKRKLKVLSYLLVMALVLGTLCGDASALAGETVSYSEYFSLEREWDDQSYDDTFSDLYIFIASIDERYVDVSNLKLGYLYSQNIRTDKYTQLTDCAVSSFDLVHDRILYTTGKEIRCIKYDGSEKFTLYSANSCLSELTANDTLAFFVMDESLYRLYIPTGTVDYIGSMVDVVDYMPASNNKVLCWKDTNAKVALSNEIELQPESSGNLEQSTSCLVFESEIGKQGSKIRNGEVELQRANARAVTKSQELSNFSTRINGVSVPVKKYTGLYNNGINTNYISGTYGNGTYFSTTHSACEYHKNDQVWSTCKEVHGAHQCLAFAWYVYHQIWGEYDGAHKNSINDSEDLNTENASRKFWDKVPLGSNVRIRHNGHSVILIGKTYSGGILQSVVIYDCNWDHHCRVKIESFTMKEIGGIASTVTQVRQPHDYEHGDWRAVGSSWHERTCGYEGCNEKLKEPHVKEGAAGYGTCMVCGYTGNISIGTTSIGDDKVTE